jgi:hypothetical protein
MQLPHCAGRGRRNVLADDDRASGAGRRELDHAELVPSRVVDVRPPTRVAIKGFGANDVRDRDDDDLEFHVHRGPRTVSTAGSLRILVLPISGSFDATIIASALTASGARWQRICCPHGDMATAHVIAIAPRCRRYFGIGRHHARLDRPGSDMIPSVGALVTGGIRDGGSVAKLGLGLGGR